MSATDPWHAVLERIDDGAKLIGLDENIHRLLAVPTRVLAHVVVLKKEEEPAPEAAVAAEAAPAEPEVIKKGKKEEEGEEGAEAPAPKAEKQEKKK